MNIHSHANPTPLWRVILEAMPLTATLVLVLLWPFDTSTPQPATAEPIELQVDSAAALEAAFSEIGYLWPPVDPVPRLALQQLPPDLAGLPTSSRKSLFFASLTPLILIENERLQHKRARLKTLLATSSLSDLERQELTTLAERYALADVLDDTQKQQQLLDRIDEIPLGLALAQAAKESGWGTSRFAQDGRNLFGVWTWDQSQGLIPAGRKAGLTHRVRVFPDLQASVRNYLHTLNTGAAYAKLRELRARQRAAGTPLQAQALAAGLEQYSERGEVYVEEIRAMIRNNQLHRLNELLLAP